MLGSVANSVLGLSPPPERHILDVRKPFVIGPGCTAYGYTFDWSPAIGHHSRVNVGYYGTPEEADAALAQALVSMNYEAPRWWQWWRYGSTKLSADVERTVSALKRQSATETNVNEQRT